MVFGLCLQGDNGRFELFLEQGGSVFEVFEAYPSLALNEAQLMIRVKDEEALDYEDVQSFTFEVNLQVC